VRVPGGPFRTGDERAPDALPAFRVDRTEVTNAAYARFLEAAAATHAHCHPDEPADKDHTPRYWREFRSPLFRASPAARVAPFDADTFRHPDRPVVGVDWWDAYAFARWAGKRLPTRREHEKAARGADGRRWPWGDHWDFGRANTGGEKWGERDGFTYAAPADSFPGGASPAGALHLAGNVAEWTDEGFVAGGSAVSPPSGVRGGAGHYREPGFRAFDLGFRCAADDAEGT
jgi:formylglycine-generating enzyme required for sulfatase activity